MGLPDRELKGETEKNRLPRSASVIGHLTGGERVMASVESPLRSTSRPVRPRAGGNRWGTLDRGAPGSLVGTRTSRKERWSRSMRRSQPPLVVKEGTHSRGDLGRVTCQGRDDAEQRLGRPEACSHSLDAGDHDPARQQADCGADGEHPNARGGGHRPDQPDRV